MLPRVMGQFVMAFDFFPPTPAGLQAGIPVKNPCLTVVVTVLKSVSKYLSQKQQTNSDV